jgi:hypothetical protein
MTSYVHDKIPTDILTELWNFYKKESIKYNGDFIISSFFPRNTKNKDIENLLIKSKIIMENHGLKFKCTENELINSEDCWGVDYLIEFHNYKINSKYEPKFGRHHDDYGGLNANVNTIIYYLEKEETIIGGNLFVYDEYTKKIIIIKSGDMVIMRGDIEHEIENMDGNGERKSIVVQIQRD